MKAPPSTPAGNGGAPLGWKPSSAYRSHSVAGAPQHQCSTRIHRKHALVDMCITLELRAAAPRYPRLAHGPERDARRGKNREQYQTKWHTYRTRIALASASPQSSVAPVYGVWDQRLDKLARGRRT